MMIFLIDINIDIYEYIQNSKDDNIERNDIVLVVQSSDSTKGQHRTFLKFNIIRHSISLF